MQKGAALSVVVLLLIACSGCIVGPTMLSREMDDWLNSQYVQAPWLYGNVATSALVGLWSIVTHIIDGVFNTYYFWVEDAWPLGDGVGTSFTHVNPPLSPANK